MRAYLISDNHDSLVGMRLAGVAGEEAHGPEETARAVQEALQMEDVGILLITEKAAATIPDLVRDLREKAKLPLVVEIPDRHGTTREADFLTKYLHEAIGVKIE